MHKFMKIVGYSVAIIGFAYVVKHIMQSKECRSDWHKVKVEEEKPTDGTVPHDINVEEEKRRGSRYGSNPVHY